MADHGLAMTRSVRRILTALVDQPAAGQHAVDIRSGAGLPLRAVYPVLVRLEALQWLDSGWDERPAGQPPRRQGDPRRRYYRLNSDGLALAQGALASANAGPPAAAHRKWRLAGDTA